MSDSEVSSGGASRDSGLSGPEQIADEIRELALSINDPDNWRVLIPVEDFDEVEDLLDAEQNLGASYCGVTLCYTDHYEQTRVEYKNDLSDHLEGSK